ncbi:MAG: SDR family oxidoreductase [Bdellovibrionaceae bacterium]|nr:SDR family oxidoreductase [Pseudobdellovibrionaceae bacterium]
MDNGMILITGANGGIGQFVMRHLLASDSRNIICHYRGENENIYNLLKEFDLDPQKHAFCADLVDEQSIQTMSSEISKHHSHVSGLLNVAGSSTNAMSWKMTKAEFMKVVEDNLLSAFLCSKFFIPDMRAKGFGRIINFSSVVGFTGMPGASHYSAAKAGLLGLTKSLALELAPKGITVNAVALGYFNAGLINDVSNTLQEEIKKKIPMNRFGEMQDVGAAVKYLLSTESQFYTGQVMHLNGGQF